jgi:transposase-like protein
MGRKPGSDKAASEELKQKIIRRFKDGDATLEEIGDEFKVSKQFVSTVLKSARLSAEARDVSQAIAKIVKLSGVSVSNLARILDVDRETVSRWKGGKQPAVWRQAQRIELLAAAMEQVARRAASSSD